MALTSEQKMRITTLLGWSAKTLISGSTHYSSYISDKLNSLNEDAETIIIEYLTRIQNIDTKLDASFAKDNIRRVDDIEFFGDNMSKMRSERKKLLCELSDLTDIPNKKGCGSSIGVIV